MKHRNGFFALLVFVFSFLIFSSASAQVPVWAKSVVNGPNRSWFTSVTTDSNGNVYTAGIIGGNGTYNFGNAVTVTVTALNNVVLVKYDSNGGAQWAKSVAGGPESGFESIAVGLNGSVYAAGDIHGTGTYDFENGVTVAGAYASGNVLLVKYDSSGNTQWAKSAVSGLGASSFYSVTVDLNENVYTAGRIDGTGNYDFGDGVTVTGNYSASNVALVKYGDNGEAQWARSVLYGSDWSDFYSVTVDLNENVYTAGRIDGTGNYDFGNGVIVTGGSSSNYDVVFVKYNSSGNAQWAKSVVDGSDLSAFYSIAIDPSGNIYAAGNIKGTSTYNFGNGVIVAGAYAVNNIVLVKYNNSGNAQWAKSVVSGLEDSVFYSVAVDSSGNIYATGKIDGTGTYNFGNGITVAGNYSNNNIILVKYNSSGNAQWAKSAVSGFDDSLFYSVSIDSSGNIYTAGAIKGSDTHDFGNGVMVTGNYSNNNIILVKYLNNTNVLLPSVTSTPTPTATASSLPNVTSTPTPTATASSLPSVKDINKSGYTNNVIVFTSNDFANNFLGGNLVKIKIMSLPNVGVLKLYGSEVNMNQEIDDTDLGNLAYVPEVSWIGSDSFMWTGSDGDIYAANPANVNINIEDVTESLNAGDIVGIISGGVAVFATVVGTVYWCLKHYQKRQHKAVTE